MEPENLLSIAINLALVMSMIRVWKAGKAWGLFAAGYFSALVVDRLAIGMVRGFIWGTPTQLAWIVAGVIPVLIIIAVRRRKENDT